MSARRKFGDWMIRMGLVMQVVFLAMVDWGTISGMSSADGTPWLHIVGLVVTNVVLLAASGLAWKLMRRAQAAES